MMNKSCFDATAKVAVVSILFFSAFAVKAGDFTILNGKTDWTDPASYKDNAANALPTSADRIFTEEGATNEIRPSHPKYAQSLEMINRVVQVQMGDSSTLVIEVADGVTNTITGRIGCKSTGVSKAPTLVKQGGGTLLQEPSVNDTYYFARWKVEEGTLGAPWAFDSTVRQVNIFSYGIDLAEKTSLILSYKQNFQLLGPLSGSGEIYTLNPSAKSSESSPFYLKGGPGTFSGTIGTNINVTVREAVLDFAGTANRYNGGLTVSGFKDDGSGKGVLGFAKFGDSASDPSSLGLRGTVSLGELYANTTPLSGAFRYLGTAGESITAKNINFGYTLDAPATFDAGAHGGLEFSPNVMWSVSEAHNQRLCLTGSNTVECTFAGKFSEGANGSVYLIKKGSGTWHLKENKDSGLSGPVRVDDGVLRHDTLASRGVLCALGTAANLHDGAYVAPGGETPVDYAVLFAGEGRGLLEYTGRYDAASTNRPVAVKTGGGFSSAGGAERIHGISAYDGAATAMLTILATNNAISTYADITDGTHGGKLGIVKRGQGTAEIDGELSFSGPLNVEGGKLIVRNSSGRYTWFRLTVKENYAGKTGKGEEADKNHVVIERFALYDANGDRQNIALARHDGNLQINAYIVGGKNNGHVVHSEASGLRPGEIGFDRIGKVNVWGDRDIQNMCEANNKSRIGCYARYDGGETLAPSNPKSWIKCVMRLAEGSAEIASFDIAGRFNSSSAVANDATGNQYRQPTAWMMEGSVDGVNWDVLTNMTWDADIAGTTWYSDRESCYNTRSGRKWQDGKSFPIRGRPETPKIFNVLGNCESVSVAPGAVLEKQGDQPVVISSLAVGTDGFGRIDGFAFAESGRLEIKGLGKLTQAVEIPGEFANVAGLENISGRRWTVYAGNGVAKKAYVKASATGLKVYPCGLVITIR